MILIMFNNNSNNLIKNKVEVNRNNNNNLIKNNKRVILKCI